MRNIGFVLALGVLLHSGCEKTPTAAEAFQSRVVTLPGGQKIRAELMIHQTDLLRGMMFRDSLAEDRGMLFIHNQPGNFPYWMYQVRIPLDIIWMDANRRIVEISENTPPCTTNANNCPKYGGTEPSMFVLELAGGMVAKYGLRVGQTLAF
ncbi:MAG: DUF192 domain-containing protein [Bryobacteraceae bacterium]